MLSLGPKRLRARARKLGYVNLNLELKPMRLQGEHSIHEATCIALAFVAVVASMQALHLKCCCPVFAVPARRVPGRQTVQPVAAAVPAQEELSSVQDSPHSDSGLIRGLNTYSKVITQQKTQGGSQAMLYATGLSEEDMHRAQVQLSPLSPLHWCDRQITAQP